MHIFTCHRSSLQDGSFLAIACRVVWLHLIIIGKTIHKIFIYIVSSIHLVGNHLKLAISLNSCQNRRNRTLCSRVDRVSTIIIGSMLLQFLILIFCYRQVICNDLIFAIFSIGSFQTISFGATHCIPRNLVDRGRDSLTLQNWGRNSRITSERLFTRIDRLCILVTQSLDAIDYAAGTRYRF